ncbi:MAG: hypothetical protein IBJ11_06715 [Phycisphaerales bacterium]|nr:hypothetical protein [Phycisphaerales bacterium]
MSNRPRAGYSEISNGHRHNRSAYRAAIDKVGRHIKKIIISLLIFACLYAAITILIPSLRREYYLALRGGDKVIAANNRRDWLLNIRDCCERFRASSGRLPKTVDEMLAFDPTCARAIRYWPEWAIEKYQIPDFSLFYSDSFVIIIDDPGLDWPGTPAINGQSPASWEEYRYVLTSDNQVYWRQAVVRAGGVAPDPKYRE